MKKGFTLLELLVVIAIIGILSSVVMVSLGNARAKSRDAKRLTDLKQIQSALTLYYNDNDLYPYTPNWWGNCSDWGSHGTSGSTGYIPNLAPNYIKELPLDPKPISTNYCYLYRSSPDSKSYMFLIYQTVEGNIIDSLKRPSNPTEKDYAAYEGIGSTY